MREKIEITKDVSITVDNKQKIDGVMHIKSYTDSGFLKTWVDMMMVALGIAGAKKGKVIGYLLKSKNSNNRVIGSFEDIAEKAEVGRMTVARTMKALQDAGLVTREYDSVYVLNPDWIWEGGHSGRMKVLMEFQELRHPTQKKYNLVPTPEDSAAE